MSVSQLANREAFNHVTTEAGVVICASNANADDGTDQKHRFLGQLMGTARV